MPKPELEFFTPSGLPWRPAPGRAGGLHEQVIAEDAEAGVMTRFLRFEPGCDTSPNGILEHDFWEEICIISGSVVDLRLGLEFTAGMVACRPPGMPHGPWRSERGCLMFEVRYRQSAAG